MDNSRPTINSVNLVLNINTPNFFGIKNQEAIKSLVTAREKPKVKRQNEKSYKDPIKYSKLKLPLSDLYKHSTLEKTSDAKLTLKVCSESNCLNKKVSFETYPEYIPEVPESCAKTNYSVQKKVSNHNEYPLKSKKYKSSLFNKLPDIPSMHIQKVGKTAIVEDVFSNNSFKDLNISPLIVTNIEKLGYSTMTKVQQLGIPPILAGNDALIKSQTGSGKTLTFALPIVHKLMTLTPRIERKQGIFAVVIVPSRELAVQIYNWMEKLCKACVWVVSGYLIGGEKKKTEKSRIRKGINILIATPGRMTDHINNTYCLNLSQVQYLVLDEADRMLDMGYEKSIKGIIHALNEQMPEDSHRQTIMLSATLTRDVMNLADISLSSPKVIDVSNEDPIENEGSLLSCDSLVTPRNLSHYFMFVPPKLRLVSLAGFLLEKCKLTLEKKVLVFMATQDMVDCHASLFSLVLSQYGKIRPRLLERKAQLIFSNMKKRRRMENISEEDDEEEDMDEVSDEDIHFLKLHGSMTQPERTAVFKSFVDAECGVLFCTDVASRGLDLHRINWIVQYNAAPSRADYVHRVGRTARANSMGSAVVFLNPSENGYVTMLEEHGIKFIEMKMEKVLQSLTHPSVSRSEDTPSDYESAASRLQSQFETVIEGDHDLHAMVVQGYTSFLRSYAAIPKDARQYFCFQLLHLGHYAKSFGLRETPSVLGLKGTQGGLRKTMKKDPWTKTSKSEAGPLLVKRKPVSEFDSGLEGIEEQQKAGKHSKAKR